MLRFLGQTQLQQIQDPGPGAPMTTQELGEHLAHMVWESFTDFLVSEDAALLFRELQISPNGGIPEDPIGGELLILFLWAHAQAVQRAFHGKDNAEVSEPVLDAFHRAIYQDMETHGTPNSELPIFEQRLGARYFEYGRAVKESEGDFGRTVAAYLSPSDTISLAALQVLVFKSREIIGPLQDFLEDLEIVLPTS